MKSCPNCGQDNAMGIGNDGTLYQCKDCGKIFCPRCQGSGGTNLGRVAFSLLSYGSVRMQKPACPNCGSTRIKSI